TPRPNAAANSAAANPPTPNYKHQRRRNRLRNIRSAVLAAVRAAADGRSTAATVAIDCATAAADQSRPPRRAHASPPSIATSRRTAQGFVPTGADAHGESLP